MPRALDKLKVAQEDRAIILSLGFIALRDPFLIAFTMVYLQEKALRENFGATDCLQSAKVGAYYSKVGLFETVFSCYKQQIRKNIQLKRKKKFKTAFHVDIKWSFCFYVVFKDTRAQILVTYQSKDLG